QDADDHAVASSPDGCPTLPVVDIDVVIEQERFNTEERLLERQPHRPIWHVCRVAGNSGVKLWVRKGRGRQDTDLKPPHPISECSGGQLEQTPIPVRIRT